MYPELSLGPLTIQMFGLMFAAGFAVSGLLVGIQLRERGMVVDWAYEIVFAALAGGIVGAKLWHALENNRWTLDALLSGTGLVWYGGAIGGALAVMAYCSWRGILSLQTADIFAPALAVGYALGRVGCQLSGDGDYGKPTDSWLGMGYPDGTVPTPPGVEVYPTPIFEAASMALVGFVLWRLRRRFAAGILICLYLVLAGLERFLIEFLRHNDRVAAGLTVAQMVSLAMIAAGLVGWFLLMRRQQQSQVQT